ncbi:MAG: hypothetical protein HUJ25_09240 [Crocinitomicaceae bacterium]|nr:hypothetical protein [Crocinitomicaceae bacterium]
MKTIKRISIIALFLLFGPGVYAQETGTTPTLAVNKKSYSTAIGLRAGGTSGLTIKQFLGQRSALEGILGVWGHGFSATLLYENHVNAFGVPGFSWYFGAGGHAAFHSGHYVYYHRDFRYEYYEPGAFGLGVDGIVGLEYKIPPIPMAISLDVKPFIEVISTGRAWMSLDPGLGIKVTF